MRGVTPNRSATDVPVATVTYRSTAADPAFGGGHNLRNVSWQVTDANGAPSAIENHQISFAPVVDLGPAAGLDHTAAFIENGAAVAIATGPAIAVGTAVDISGASVVLTNAVAGDSLVVGALPGGITVEIEAILAIRD